MIDGSGGHTEIRHDTNTLLGSCSVTGTNKTVETTDAKKRNLRPRRMGHHRSLGNGTNYARLREHAKRAREQLLAELLLATSLMDFELSYVGILMPDARENPLVDWVLKAIYRTLTSDRGSQFVVALRQRSPRIRAALQPAMSAVHARIRKYYAVKRPAIEPLGSRPRLLVDVSTTFHMNQTSGIQRTVRSVVSALKRNDHRYPFEVVAVRLNRAGTTLTLVSAPDFPDGRNSGEDLALRPGDRLLMLDSSWDIFPQWAEAIFPIVRELDGVIITCIYDILPLTDPHFFPSSTVKMFVPWFKIATCESDLLLSISSFTRCEVRQHSNISPKKSDFFHLGADFASVPKTHFSVSPREIATVLMVGTIEPRKGHSTVLDAFDTIWQSGQQVRLIFLGKPGWKVKALLRRIRKMNRENELFVFHEGASDELLSECYRVADVVVAASLAEGFGLPLVETLMLGKPIVASDIPAFREVAGDLPEYFEAGNPAALVAALNRVLSGKAPEPKVLPTWLTWDQSADQLIEKINEFCVQNESALA